MEKKINELRTYLNVVKQGDLLMMIVDSIACVVATILIKEAVTDIKNRIQGDFPYGSVGWAFVSTLVFILLITVRFRKQKYYPSTIADDIESTGKLKAVLSDKYRTDTINGYVDKAISELNNNTCNSSMFDENALCDQDLEAGITKVLHSVIKRPDIFLNCICTKFSVIALINYCPFKEADGRLSSARRPFILRDEFDIKDLFYQSMGLAEKSEPGAMYKIYKTAQESIDQMTMCSCELQHNGQNLNLITISIPNVCENGSTGVLYLFYEGEEKILPNDFEQFLKIFCRITTNWISKYGDCINSRHQDNIYHSEIDKLTKQVKHYQSASFDPVKEFVKEINKFTISEKPDEVINGFFYNQETPSESTLIWGKKK